MPRCSPGSDRSSRSSRFVQTVRKGSGMKKAILISVLLVGMALGVVLGVLLDRAIAPSPSAAPPQAPLAAAPAVPAPPAKVNRQLAKARLAKR